jgi:D-alanyl-D-alanine carboxypeptidase/D-alanyl-D-alanine-endopeptidase (penicillin-binding protein 4)
VPPDTLGRLLLLAADGAHSSLAPLLDGLPVAGFSGTLVLRFGTGPPGSAAGLVRAKTGTLTGVSALAGTTSVDGHPVVFVVMSDEVPDGATLQARDDLDRFAAVLSNGSASS